MTIEEFAEKYRLRITRDDCNDPVILGLKGHLYFDWTRLCLMSLDARFTKFGTSHLSALGGLHWEGAISRDPKGRRIRDVKIVGIPEENYNSAAKIIHQRRATLSPEELERRRRQMASINSR